jgi:hypothetical protein
MPKKPSPPAMPVDIQLQNLWLSSARSGRFRQQPTQTDLRMRGRYLGLADLIAVYCWLLVFALAIASAIWLFA